MVGAVLAVGAGVPWLLLLMAVLSARFGSPAGSPHGYTNIFGTLLAVPCGLVAALGMALAAPRGRQALVLGFAVPVALLVSAGLLVLLADEPRWAPPGGRSGAFAS